MEDRPGAQTLTDGRAGRRPAYLGGALLTFSGLVDVGAAPGAVNVDPYCLLIGNDLLRVDFTGWAWLRLAVSVVTAVAGLAVIANRRWSARVAVVAAGVSVVLAVLAFGYTPLRTLLEVPLNLAAVRLILRRR